MRYRIRKDDVAWQNLAPEAVLVHLQREVVHVANPTAATIIEALQDEKGATLPELVEKITSAYEVESAQAAADIEAFLKVALEAGLLAEETKP